MVMDMMIFLHIIISDEDKEEEEEDTTEIHETFLYHLIPGLRFAMDQFRIIRE